MSVPLKARYNAVLAEFNSRSGGPPAAARGTRSLTPSTVVELTSDIDQSEVSRLERSERHASRSRSMRCVHATGAREMHIVVNDPVRGPVAAPRRDDG